MKEVAARTHTHTWHLWKNSWLTTTSYAVQPCESETEDKNTSFQDKGTMMENIDPGQTQTIHFWWTIFG